jgi:hypothetical protein
VTRDEFEALMTQDGWTPDQRQKFNNFTPIADAKTFRAEMSRPDGVVECRRHDDSIAHLNWKRMFKKRTSV